MISPAQRHLAGIVKYPRPCRLCWVWASGPPPLYLGYVLDEYSGQYVKRCIACRERCQRFDWILDIPPGVFQTVLDMHPQGFTLETLAAAYQVCQAS